MGITAYKLSGSTLSCPASSVIINRDPEGQLLLHWLIFSSSSISPSSTKVVWDLSRLASLVLSALPDSARAELSRPPHRARWNAYKLFYIPDKVLSVNKNGSEASFYDLSQWFPREPEPSTLSDLQSKADQLSRALADLGIPNLPSLSSPIAAFKGHKLLGEVQDTVPTIFDAPESVWDAFGIAAQCTPREWVSNYQIGIWEE